MTCHLRKRIQGLHHVGLVFSFWCMDFVISALLPHMLMSSHFSPAANTVGVSDGNQRSNVETPHR